MITQQSEPLMTPADLSRSRPRWPRRPIVGHPAPRLQHRFREPALGRRLANQGLPRRRLHRFVVPALPTANFRAPIRPIRPSVP
jgi:hypothetical protein